MFCVCVTVYVCCCPRFQLPRNSYAVIDLASAQVPDVDHVHPRPDPDPWERDGAPADGGGGLVIDPKKIVCTVLHPERRQVSEIPFRRQVSARDPLRKPPTPPSGHPAPRIVMVVLPDIGCDSWTGHRGYCPFTAAPLSPPSAGPGLGPRGRSGRATPGCSPSPASRSGVAAPAPPSRPPPRPGRPSLPPPPDIFPDHPTECPITRMRPTPPVLIISSDGACNAVRPKGVRSNGFLRPGCSAPFSKPECRCMEQRSDTRISIRSRPDHSDRLCPILRHSANG